MGVSCWIIPAVILSISASLFVRILYLAISMVLILVVFKNFKTKYLVVIFNPSFLGLFVRVVAFQVRFVKT